MAQPGSRAVHRYILETFAATGRSPSLEDIRRRFDLATVADADSLVRELERAGTVHRSGGDSGVTHAYPFSNEPTSHRVHLAGGPEVYAMCAIDALGMPFMLDRDAVIRSACQQCAATIEVEMEARKVVHSSPEQMVVWLSDVSEDCVLATDLCPDLNFFCSPEHLEDWRQAHADGVGRMLTLAQAIEIGRRSFEDLLHGTGQLRIITTR